MNKYKVLKNVWVLDKGQWLDNRFESHFKKVKANSDQFVFYFYKDEIYHGADRTELGQFMLVNKLIKEI